MNYEVGIFVNLSARLLWSLSRSASADLDWDNPLMFKWNKGLYMKKIHQSLWRSRLSFYTPELYMMVRVLGMLLMALLVAAGQYLHKFKTIMW